MGSPPLDIAVPLLIGARIQDVRQPAPLEVALLTHRAGQGAATWLLSADPQGARLVQTFVPPRTSPRPGQFLLWLRTRLEGGIVESLTVANGQVVTLSIRQKSAAFRLVLEMNGRESNLLLLGEDGRVLAALHPAKEPASDAPYQPPQRLHRYPKSDPPRLPVGDPQEAQALDALWRTRLETLEFQAMRSAALRRIKSREDKLRRRLEHIAGDRVSPAETERLREQAELLQIHRAALKPGLSEITLPNEFLPERPPVTIALDPAAGPGANIERLFQRYRKQKDGAAHVERRLSETERELERWARLREAVEGTSDLAGLRQLAEPLPLGERAVVLPPPARSRERQVTAGLLTRVSADGYTIYVGRSKEENDEVTFRIGRGRDWWLHALGVPGAHVLVRNPNDGALPPATLRQAGWLAAYYSKGRAQGSLEVTCTQRKHVRKIKGAEPGTVTHALGRTFWVDLADPQGRAILEEGESEALDV